MKAKRDKSDYTANAEIMAQMKISDRYKVVKNMTAVFSSKSIKGFFFFFILLENINNVINNLSTHGVNKFSKIKLKMLAIAYLRTQLIDKKAYYIHV